MIQTPKNSWKILSNEYKKRYFQNILSFLEKEIASGKNIYPLKENIFQAFELCPFENTRIIILGQDPYHGPRQAHGLSFSVQDDVKLPPSLKNIYRELQNEGYTLESPLKSGDLEAWAKQGVLLLNSILTVEASKPASHAKIGWETFTDSVISKLSQGKDGLIFLLWGNFARSKKILIDTSKHHILEAPHPSPFSAHT